MEFATGAMGTLIPKLGKLLIDEYNLKDTVKKGIGDLKAKLESMQVFLVKVSSVPLDQLDPQVKIWANEVRELSYAIEDSLDSFMTRVTKAKFKNWLKKARNKFTKFKARHEIANDMEEFESQVRKIKERYDRYKINDVVANSATTSVDPRLSALYNKVSDLVGTDAPIDELMKILSKGAEASKKNLKIVSIVGFEGLGKTTLAKALYDKVSKTYDHQGFVPVGQNKGAKKVLSDILFELDKKLYKTAECLDEWQLINQLRGILAGKRYFIVIDDLWDIATRETIKNAFMDSHPDSRIIITTRKHDVATNSGGIYRMKPLSDDNSKMLFHTRTCGAEGVSQDNQPDEVVINKILKKCAGVPLAIISIASLLVGKPSADWSKVYDAIGFGDEDSEVIQDTRKILSFSYYDLRPYLKTCLLYLGMYPEDKFIHKKSLIWRWVSEGFVQHKQGISSYELGESYYNELVNKSLIREVSDDKGIGRCVVHDMVLDMIRKMSNEVNFITVKDKGEDLITSLPKVQSNRVHRLAFHRAKVEDNLSIKMGHVRSFNATMCTDTGLPPLLTFKVLRVLVIEDCVFSEGLVLKHLGKLVQLRYLGIVNTSVKLPEDIGVGLKFLEILDVRGGSISELPPSVGELQNLRCLWASKGTRMKGEIGKLTCLEELLLDQADKVPNFFRDVGKLTKLRVLVIWLDRLEHTAAKVLAVSLLNLHKIQDLFIKREEVKEAMDLYKRELHVRAGSLEELMPSSSLRTFVLPSILIPKMPSWINALSVPFLSQLILHVEVVEPQDLQILGRLPSLITLVFLSAEKKCVSYIFGSDEFQKLKLLATNVEITLGEGALPMLEELAYSASAERKDSLVPWNKRCPLLDDVECVLDCAASGSKEVKAANAVLRKAANVRAGSLEELTPSSRLHTFALWSILITKMPSWINALSVPLLSVLMLYVEVVEGQDLQILGRLPSLIFLGFFGAEKKCVSYTFGSDEFQKLKLLATNVEITLGEGALPMLKQLVYSASAGRKDSLVPWNKSCPLLHYVECMLDCANSGSKEVKAAKAVLRKAERAHPNAEDLSLDIDMKNYNRKAAGLVDALSSILDGLDRADQGELRHMITSLETVLRDDEEPRVGGYGEQDLSGFVAKFKSLLLSDAATDQDGEPDNSNDDDENTEQEKGDNDVSTSSGMHHEGAERQP